MSTALVSEETTQQRGLDKAAVGGGKIAANFLESFSVSESLNTLAVIHMIAELWKNAVPQRLTALNGRA